MKSLLGEHLLESLRSSFISGKNNCDESVAPLLLVNDYKREKKILSSICDELSSSISFDFSVAFINNEGIASIKEILDELERKGVRGRINTTNYLNFTQPSALEELLSFSNIELRAYTLGGFHPKGYIFEKVDSYSIVIGSANLTASALTSNQEWSLKFVSSSEGSIVHSIRSEFERIWEKSEVIDNAWIKKYKKEYERNKYNIAYASDDDFLFNEEEEYVGEETKNDVIPNSMQKEAICALKALRERGEKRALIIAATGTGKTYLSVFDTIDTKPKRLLYVAHRVVILNKARKSYEELLKTSDTALLNGSSKLDGSPRFIFASIYTLAKDEYLKTFRRDEFDYIVIDEVHHAGAKSYKKIIEYFKPKFMLGLTATPERTDGEDIFSLFDNNIAYEIRLKRAMEEDLLCPFHYYGLSDLTVNGEVIDDKSDFSKLISNERVRHIKGALLRYRNFAYPVKGLIFCSRVEEAKELSKLLNNEGFITKYLTGENSDREREEIIDELEDDNKPLEYIISVDIFNEGVDIPSVNQVVMLRPTQSAIIFTQQLGRGLRKNRGKKYLSVIDFIGNYENNFFIPIALYGDNSYNKDNLRKALSSGSTTLPGSSTIQISEIAKQGIFQAINNTSFKQLKLLKEEYLKLKLRLARVPFMVDFVQFGAIDPFLFVDYCGTYYEFLRRVEKNIQELKLSEILSLQFVSFEFARGERVHELLLLKYLIEEDEITLSSFKQRLEKYSVFALDSDIKGMCNTLSPNFYTKPDLKKYGKIEYVELAGDRIRRREFFSNLLKSSEYKRYLLDTLNYGLERARIKDDERYVDHNFILYRKYTRKDVCKLLNWKKNETAQNIGGYLVKNYNNELTCPVFVTYKKANDIAESINYDDYFINSSELNWMSKNKRTSSSPDVKAIIDQKTNGIKIPLFVKKNDKEGSEFYYLGNMTQENFKDTKMNSNGKLVNVVNVKFDLETPVSPNLFKYLTS